MKKLSFLFSLIISLMVACRDRSKVSTETTGDVNAEETRCFRYSTEKDSVLLSITYSADSVRGTLKYYLAEKDKNIGTIKGKLANDLLLGEYTFQSEGIESKRQVAFKKDGNDLIEGYGEIQNTNGNSRFVNIDSLKFSESIILKETNCRP
jgi:hypothetical protein